MQTQDLNGTEMTLAVAWWTVFSELARDQN